MLFRRLEFCKHIVRALLVLIFGVCSAEVAMRIYEIRSQGSGAPQNLEASLLIDSRTTHHKLKPLSKLSATNPDSGQPTEIVTNSLGLRGQEIAVPKPANVYRIICLGDETVFGADVQQAETFCARLQNYLQSRTRLKIDVVNAGVPGFCPLLSYLQMKHELLGLQPDLILLNFDMSDVSDDYRYRRHTRIDLADIPLVCPNPQFQNHTQNLQSKIVEQFLVSRWCLNKAGCLWQEKVQQVSVEGIENVNQKYAWLKNDPPDWSVYIQQSLSAINHLKILTDGIYARMIVATYPAPWQISEKASNGPGVREQFGVADGELYTSDAPFNVLAQFTNNQRIPFCNTSAAFRQTAKPEQFFLKNAPRFSVNGHHLYALELAKYIVSNVPGIWIDSPTDGAVTPTERQARIVPNGTN